MCYCQAFAPHLGECYFGLANLSMFGSGRKASLFEHYYRPTESSQFELQARPCPPFEELAFATGFSLSLDCVSCLVPISSEMDFSRALVCFEREVFSTQNHNSLRYEVNVLLCNFWFLREFTVQHGCRTHSSCLELHIWLLLWNKCACASNKKFRFPRCPHLKSTAK